MLKLCLGRKISLCAILFLLFSCFSTHAQITNPAMGTSPWNFANPTPHGYGFSDMSFIDNNNGLAVCGGGATSGGIMKTTDGGRNWQFTTFKFVTNTGAVALGTFNDVQYITPTIAYAVGNTGLMIKSIDGGANWTTINTPLTPMGKNINAMHFINKDTGYIGGQALLTTTATLDINAAPKIYFTRNGGATWDSLASPFRPQQNAVTFSGYNTGEIHRIHFANDSVGYASGSCATAIGNFSAIVWKIEKNVVKDYSLHRTKFGISATSGAAANHTPSTQTYKGCLAINDSVVLISSLNNNIVMRIKTGKNDSTANAVPAIYGAYERGKYELVVSLTAFQPFFPAPLVNNVAGQMPHLRMHQGKVYMTVGSSIAFSVDHGTNWTYTRIHPATAIYAAWPMSAIDVTPNGRIIVGSFNGLSYDSLPGVAGWQTKYNNQRPLFYSILDIDFADFCNGVAVGANGTILKTSDGGKSWINNSEPFFEAAQVSLGNVIYPATDRMFFTAGASLYRSADQGVTNNALFTEPSGNASINNFTLVGDKAFIVAHRFSGVQRTHIYRVNNVSSGSITVDTYNNFVTGPTGNLAPQLRNIKFANADTGYTCGSRGKVFRTIDGGNNWTDISPDTLVNSNGTATYTALSVVNGRTLYIGGSSRKLFKSTDAGATWTDMTFAVPPAPTPITNFTSVGNIVMNDASNGYIHAGNILMKTTDGWSTYTYDLAPASITNFMLYPKLNLPINQKKLLAGHLGAGFPGPNSTQTAFIFEYGNSASYNMSTTETTTNASCSNPTAGSITITATGGITPYTYSINGGTPQSSNVFAGLTTGNKTVTIRDAGCQVITKTINVGFTDNLTLTTNNDTTVCANAPVQMLASANLAGTSFTWSPATGLTNANIANPIATTGVNRTYTVTATLNSCVRTKPVVITIKANPIINAGPDKTIVVGDQVQLEGSANNPVTIAWTPNSTLTNANTFTPTAAPTTTTTYTLTVLNNQGCTSTDQATVNVIPYCIKVMSAFTPNGDGINDKWLVTDGNACTSQIKVAVYNRYGNVVYSNDNYTNNWDGQYKGKPVADGTYYYNIAYKTITGKTILAKGDVTILR